MYNYTLRKLEIAEILSRRHGSFVFAKYRTWRYFYTFFISFSGRVRGRASDGSWLVVSKGLASTIQRKCRSFLGKYEINK